MAGKMVEVIGSNPNVIPDVALDFAKRYGEDSNLPIIAITLEGSHSKALQNPQSDLDVVVHYFRPLKHLVCLNPPGLQQPAFVRDLEQAKKDGNATYTYKGIEVEVIPEPIYSVSETGNKLFPLLIKAE